MSKKIRQHSEYFRTVSLSGRKSCPNCSVKLAMGEQVWSWGNYVRAKWYTVQYFCKECFSEGYSNPKQRLIEHAKPCGCTFNLIGYRGEKLPAWLTLETNDNVEYLNYVESERKKA